MKTPLTNCPTKVKSRVKSIIDPWKLLTGKDHVPAGQCYVTLCGPMSNGNGHLFPYCELLHLTNEGFIKPRQFHGIERDEIVWQTNVDAVNNTFTGKNKPCLHEPDDLVLALARLLSEKKRIAVLNIDLQVGPKMGIWHLTRALSMLNTSPGYPTLVVWNVLVKSPYRGRDMSPDLNAVLCGYSRFQNAREKGHWESPRQVRYRRASTTMHSLVLCRSGEAT